MRRNPRSNPSFSYLSLLWSILPLPPDPPTQDIRYQIEKGQHEIHIYSARSFWAVLRSNWCRYSSGAMLANGQGLDRDWSPFLDFIVSQEGVSPMAPLISGHFSALLQTCSSHMSFISQNSSGSRGILVILVMHQIWSEKIENSVLCFCCTSDMVLYRLIWEKQWASLNFVPTHLFSKIWDFFVPGTHWQFLVK